MKAITFDSPGGPEVLKVGEYEKPVPSEKEILIKVQATAINRADTLQRMGKYPPPKGASPVLGLELAGEVVEAGQEIKKWKTGDKIFGLIPGGGYAEYAVIHEDMAMRIPENISVTEAAAIPEVFLTAFQALAWYGKTEKGNSVLIHAGGSGVGTAGIQIAREIGADIYITASSSKHKACLDLGAKKAIDYKTQNFDEEILKYTDGKGVDIIVDFVSGPYFKMNIESLKTDGRLIILASLGGGNVDEFDLRKILVKRLSIIGSTLRSRPLDYQVKLTKDFSDFALTKFKEGKMKPVIDSVFDWKDASEAHRYMESNKNTGKIVLEVS
ncbi:MAG: NAD(P)H-quinone oxidoreductase [Ignavibacteriaceae bacterium]